MNRLVCLITCVALTGISSATVVVDASGGFEVLSSNLSAARSESVNSDTERTYLWSDSAYLFDGGADGTKIYGGVQITSVSNLLHSGVGSSIRIESGPNELRASVLNNNDEGGGPSEARVIYLWDSTDFQGEGPYAFDETSDSSIMIQAGSAYFDPGGTRYVIRDGSTYYVSSLEGITEITGNAVYSINGASSGLQWASFDPSEFATFDTDIAGFGLPSLGSFSSRTFSNVTGAGLIGESDRNSFTRLEIKDFEVNLIAVPPDTSLPGYGSHPFSVVDTVVDSSTGNVTLSWEAALNQRFSIERSVDLSEWTVIASNYPALGADSNRVMYVDTEVASDQIFYRVSRPYDPDKPLNVLIIVVDDLRDHESYSLNNIVQMPSLDRFAATGIKFENAFCQATYCNPSRASFLTGLRPETTGILNNEDYFRDSIHSEVADAVTLPQCFRSNGYYTVSLGKILHGTQMDPLSWDVQINTFAYTPAGNTGEWINMTSNAASPLSWCKWRAPDCEDNDLGDGIMAERAVEILREKRTDPFFIALGFKKPHDPFDAPKKYFDMYPLTNLVLHVDPLDASPLPPQALAVTGGSMTAFNAMSDDDRRQFLRCYAACSTYVDAQIGKVFDAMDELGLWQNTIVMLWTDHGYHQGERGWWNKTLLDTYDAKVPFMAYVPEMPVSGVMCTGVVELVDVYPTLTELAGLVPPVNLEGDSFASLLNNPEAAWAGVAVSQRTSSSAIVGTSVFDGRYRYTEWEDGEKQLFDHETDPGEWYNLSSNPAYDSIMQNLSTWVQ